MRFAKAGSGMILAAAVLGAAPAGAQAALSTFGSPLSGPATLNTSENLGYAGTNTPLPGYVFHTPHDGADTALWNVAGNTPAAPADGQVVKIELEGCAQQAEGGPAPLNQIHFQILTPTGGGTAKVQLTSQPFAIPVCGQGGASGATVSSYEPINFCVVPGDFVDFNDEGGYVENVYRSGVPYQVIGAARNSTMDSFIMGDGTGNGATLSAAEVSSADGFAANAGEELMLRATLGTGPDARYVCPGGTKEAPPQAPTAPVKLLPQTDAINRRHAADIVMYCRVAPACEGTASLSALAGGARYGAIHIDIPVRRTTHLEVPLAGRALRRFTRRRRTLPAALTVAIGGQVVQQKVTLKIF
ncbi:MAG TPA: hypothetical protein VMU32_05710 [Solirubrobacteraceae bacterium]|nr:hypothetical protein [Solirubrobacteraceae bacterium]